MNDVHNRVYLLSGPESCSEKMSKKVEALRERLTPRLTDDPTQAQWLLGLGDVASWPKLPFDEFSANVVYVWFESFASEKDYESVVGWFPQATFMHGIQGLMELTSLFEDSGIIKAETTTDPLAEDAFFRMKGDYLNQLDEEISKLAADTAKKSGSTDAAVMDMVRRVAGSAGTYEFESLSSLAISSLNKHSKKKPTQAAKNEILTALEQSVQEELDQYRQQVEQCLPALVELEVRQRVLALVDDPSISKQLQFALNHSRIQTVSYENPGEILAALHSIQPDILVVQQAMRNFDGLDLAAYVRSMERFEPLPILALLNAAGESTISRATRGGVDSWLTIPFSAANVALSVLNLLHRVEVARKLGGRDSLTGLYTKEALVDRLTGDLSRVARSGQQLAAMLIHLVGNPESPRLAFLELTEIANRVFRRSDLLSRYNEATLGVVLPGIDTRTVLTVISRFRSLLADAHQVEIVASITDGSAGAEALLADVETRLAHVLGGDVDAAIGVYEPEVQTDTARTAPKVLIADTDEAIVNLLRFFCAREGFDVADVRTGTDTLEYLEKAREDDKLPEVIVLEAFLPGVDGFQILEKVGNDYGNRIAVIMLSVSPSEDRVSKAFQMGATDFISKPFRVPEIIARIRNGILRSCGV